MALCQGGALHYVNKRNGSKDSDVWSFYRISLELSFPQRRRRTIWDFGDPCFGHSPDSPKSFVRKRVDVFVKGVPPHLELDESEVVRRYLEDRKTKTAVYHPKSQL